MGRGGKGDFVQVGCGVDAGLTINADAVGSWPSYGGDGAKEFAPIAAALVPPKPSGNGVTVFVMRNDTELSGTIKAVLVDGRCAAVNRDGGWGSRGIVHSVIGKFGPHAGTSDRQGVVGGVSEASITVDGDVRRGVLLARSR